MSEFRKTCLNELYFVTLTVVGWIDLFSRKGNADIIMDNLKFCQLKEGLEIYAYVIMPNHVHMVTKRNSDDTLMELLGRFKGFTSKKLIAEIENNIQESRKEWLLYMFKYFAKKNKQYSEHHLWHYSNFPVELYSNDVIDQKVDYIHNNPVRAGIVTEPHHYHYSSAHPDSPLKVLPL